MKNLKITNIPLKEKEHALSLLRIPINFFAEEPQKPKLEKKEDSSKTSDTPSSPKEDAEKINVELNDNGSAHINISKELEFDSPSEKSQTSSTQPKKEDSETPAPSEPSYKPEEKSESPTEAQASKKNEASTNEKAEHQKQEATTAPDSKSAENSTSTPAPASDSKTAEKPVSSPTPSPDSKQAEKPASSPTPASDSNKAENSSTSSGAGKSTSPSSSGSQKSKNSSSNQEPSSSKKQSGKSSGKPSDGSKKQKSSDSQSEADRLKNKFANKNPINRAKNNIRNNIAKNPLGQKALNGLDKVNNAKKTLDNAKDAINNLNSDKMKELAGDIAVKAAGAAANTVAPGTGKIIEAADKLLGQTEVGKKAKKALGGCCALGCMTSCIIILLPIIVLISSFSWITNLFGQNNNYYGDELTTEEYNLLAEASTEYSMQDYTDLTTNLNNPSFLQSFFGTSSDYPIQEALETYLDDYYYYTEEMVKKYEKPEYQKLIEQGYIMKVEVGELTSFGSAFNLLTDNYSIENLKAPSSAPQREKEVNGEKVTYTTYDPTGIHQALFQDVLTNIDGLKNRFNKQVDKAWFDELNTILDTKHDVYILEFNETRNLSLRELFIETSSVAYDTEYHVTLLKTAFEQHSAENAEIVAEYNELVKRLSMLELMTYMLDYQQYYQQIEDLKVETSGHANSAIFSDSNFWGQFLTFSNVEHYLGLSSLTDHSLAYEIAVTSIGYSVDSAEISIISKPPKTFAGLRQFSNWYATYYFEPQVTTNGSEYSYSMKTTKIEPTGDQKRLFDKYNIYSGIFDNDTNLTDEEKALRNENSFFALFESATGIKIGKLADDGTLQTALYETDKTGIINRKYLYNNRAFPVSYDSSLINISIGFDQRYSFPPYEIHKGIDYSVPSGTTIVAAESGTAYINRGNTGFGNYVKIVHDDGYTSFYAHGNGTFFINNGSRVVAGQPIMESGNSGNTTGPHLHFEVRDPSGISINPTDYIYEST